jgi:hypothetical protein
MNHALEVPFRPNLQGVFQERFYRKILIFKNENIESNEIDALVSKEVDWATNNCKINIQQRRIYRAVWLLIQDLLRTGWQYKVTDGVLVLILPGRKNSYKNVEEIIDTKDKIRNYMESSRIEKIYESKEFIKKIEAGGNGKKAISEIISSGNELYERLKLIKEINDKDLKNESLKNIIKPYLQLVSDGDKDFYTGLKLTDIWRYFRLTWANPAESTPGRTMCYLIRDAAVENHPVMGIASLENSALQITCRDDHIGWTVKAFKENFYAQEDTVRQKMFNELLQHIEIGINEIDYTGLCSKEECQNPNDVVISKLKTKVIEAMQLREESLKNDKDTRSSKLGGKISKKAENALYMRKRAEQLATLFNAKKRITGLLNENADIDHESFIESEEGQSAIRTALLAIKRKHIGSSIMELNVCGAIPPYNNILSGKLIAMLMLSPVVIDNYKQKYGNKPSQIASLLKGEDVTRPAELVYIGTTSLYHVGSSQYNRIRLPNALFHKNSREVVLKKLGVTAGHGTMHISSTTVNSLIEVSKGKRGFKHINNVFGEGASPKMRIIAMGVRDVMEDGSANLAASVFSKHSMSRIVYGVRLINNFDDYIYGHAVVPEYYYDGLNSAVATETIVDYWKQRWLLMRLSHLPALELVKNFCKESLLVSQAITKGKERVKLLDLEEEPVMNNSTNTPQARGKLDYFRRLYRGISGCADHIDIDTLRNIHVETDLDAAIIEILVSGKSVVLTGNPGDGKTHLLRIIEDKFKNAKPEVIFEYDASCLKDEEIINRWRGASNAGKTFCIAINEAVLFGLISNFPDFEPLVECREQLTKALYYDEEPDVKSKHVVVFDLSLRNTLAQEIVSAIIDKQTDTTVLDSCNGCVAIQQCDFRLHAELLKNDIVRERLQYVFDRLNRRGYHFTLREIEGYFSFLLFAKRNCEELSRGSSSDIYYFQNLIYGSNLGLGPIFEKLKDTFDPSKVSHPVIDELLVNGVYAPGTWISNFNAESNMIEPGNYAKYESRKRAFFFFNVEGSKLIDIADDDESEFFKFIEKQEREAIRQVISQLNLFFSNEKSADSLYAWQSLRYDHSPRKVLYSSTEYERIDFEIVKPKLHRIMGQGFTPRIDHVLFRLKDKPTVALKIDYGMFEVLANAKRGVPMMYLESSLTRRIWQFIENLDREAKRDEVSITIYDTQTKEKCVIEVDKRAKQYIGLKQEGE